MFQYYIRKVKKRLLDSLLNDVSGDALLPLDDWTIPQYNRYFPIELRLARISTDELEKNRQFTKKMKQRPEIGPIKKAIWFLPHLDHALKGGIRTNFMVAEQFSIVWGTHNIIAIDNFLNRRIKDSVSSQIKKYFPELDFELQEMAYSESPNNFDEVDIGICTLWPTAYTLARYNKCKAKFYFMQDYEPMFYSGGSISSVIEATYRLGFYTIANTPGIAAKSRQYSTWGVSFIPGIDSKVFHPGELKINHEGPYQIVFYGRPRRDRNCFTLGCEALRLVKEKLNDEVRIISVGENFPASRYFLQDIMEVRGLLKTMDEVANLYRNSDLGISLMATPHPSYQPIEYMACGCPTLTNRNELLNWLYLDGENVIQTDPIIEIMADRIIETLANKELREKVIRGGFKTASDMSWDKAYEKILNYIGKPLQFDKKDS